MTAARRELWGEFFTSLAISLGIAICIVPFLQLPAINKVFVWVSSGLIFGVGFFLLGTVRSRIRAPYFALNLLLLTALTFGTLVCCFVAMAWSIAAAQQPSHILDAEMYRELWRFLLQFGRSGLYFVGLGLLGSAVINGSFQIGRKLGPGVLWQWVTGRYYTPREEEMIFMFLDMKDSTALGERLGTLRFSALVRDVFRDLTYPVLESRARISHFIGDEAVIYWRPADGLKGANCIRLFFRFADALASREGYYQTAYGLVPNFKAGLHMGPVVATEVGEIKSEIVFHGDTLNTAARIQGMCNELGSLLLSEEVVSRLTMPQDLIAKPLGSTHLKGKADEVRLFAIEARNTSP